ncbi:MAG: TatD family hydrolase [Spirochaetales bacterium]|nr:TatD family hydrolase [Spirochaetales bacterium]
MLDKGMDPFSIYDELFREGFEGGIDIGCTHDDLPHRSEILKPYPGILLAGAMGPWEAGARETGHSEPEQEFSRIKSLDDIAAELDVLKGNIQAFRPAFIGEIGLDYHWEYGTHEKQHLIFETQLRWAEDLGLAVLIHDRDADDDMVDAIRRLSPSKGGVIHCFDGCERLMQQALDRGFYISFAGNLTYRSNTQLRDMLRKVPTDRLLLETDSPYLAPVPMRGKPNCPAYVIHTYECAAQTLEMEMEALKELVASNFKTLISK